MPTAEIEEMVIPDLSSLARRFPARDRRDMMSEGVLAILQSVSKYDATKGSFHLWAFRRAWQGMILFAEMNRVVHVCRNIQLKYRTGKYQRNSWRSESVRMAFAQPEPIDDVPDYRRDAEGHIDECDLLERIDVLISMLDERSQSVLNMRYKQEIPMPVIAKRIKVTRQRAYQIENEALSMIRSNLDGDEKNSI